MKTRLELMTLLPMHSVGAEIGVFTGRFSAEILAIVRPKKLYLVDKFEGWISSGIYDDGKFSEDADMGTMLPILQKRFDDQPAVEIVKGNGADWMASVPRGHLDWVYIDSSHAYTDTALELLAAKLAVKKGGIISGHDWHLSDVRRAVELFCSHSNPELQVESTSGAALPSWMIQL